MAEDPDGGSPEPARADRAKILAWILLVFAAIFAAGSVAWSLVAGRPAEVIQVRARHILVEVGPDATDEVRTKAEQLVNEMRDQILGGADFAKLARDHSACPSKAEGGDLGWFGRGNMAKEFEQACWAAEVGELVGPVRTQFGYHLIEVLEKR